MNDEERKINSLKELIELINNKKKGETKNDNLLERIKSNQIYKKNFSIYDKYKK